MSTLRVSRWLLTACGVWLVALGVYFIVLRPALLPEDPRFMGTTLEQIRIAVPGLEAWLQKVFTVMGGFMAGAGVLTVLVAAVAMPLRAKGTSWALAISGALTVVLMSATNFALHSDFRWLLLLPALVWLAGLVIYLADRGAEAPTLRHESSGFVQAPMDRVFAHLDDHTRLSSHMSEPSWKMGGGSMNTELDAGRGQQLGSHIRLSGRVFGVELVVDEIVVQREPPRLKVWETTGVPKLLVIGRYRMGFDLSPQGGGSMLRVFIEYALPENAPARWLGRLFGRYYAQWCTRQMVDDAVNHFQSLPLTQGST